MYSIREVSLSGPAKTGEKITSAGAMRFSRPAATLKRENRYTLYDVNKIVKNM